MEIIKSFFFQLFFTVGILVIFGLLIALLRRVFCRIIGRAGPKILLATGIIGTPIHELSHALMCLIFGHRIDEIKLYDPNSEDGNLGYVSHSFNTRNIYHQIGNFFIGVAPILGGSGVLLLLSLFVPSINADIIREFHLVDEVSFLSFLQTFGNIIKSVFDFRNMGNFLWWLFIILSFSVASHMELSPADIKGSVKGFLILSGALLVADIIMFFASPQVLNNVTNAITSFSVSIAAFLALSIIFLLTMVLLALIVKGIMKIFRR